MEIPGLLVRFNRQECIQCGKYRRLHEVFMGLAKCTICGDISLNQAEVEKDIQYVG